MSQIPKFLQAVWAAVVLFGFGCGLGTYLHRRSRLPAWFWLPSVSAAACLVCYALFFVSFVNPTAGRLAAWTCWVASVALFVRAWRDADVRGTLVQRDAWLPVLLSALLTASFVASVFASHAGINQRFSYQFPPDNVLPRYFAERVYDGSYRAGVPPAPLDVDWRTSDRPPVQAAIALASLPFEFGDHGRFYQFVATICQMGWVAAFYALARTIPLPRRYLQFALIAAATSAFFFFNSVYTWPKLLAAWLFVFGLALALYVVRERGRASASVPSMAAGAMALGLLAHGGVAFSVLALPLLATFWRPWRAMRPPAIVAAATVAIVLSAPWMAYQRFYDPPGNRLLKFHFAGVEDIDARGTLEAIRDTYGALTWHDYIAGRWANVTRQWFGTYPIPVTNAIDWVQWQQLMRHVPMLGFLCIGYLVLIWTPPRSDLPDASLRVVRQLLWYALATLAIWIVVMIVPSSTLIHQGSYVMTWLLVFGAAVLVAMLPLLVRGTVLALHMLVFATCYFFSIRTAHAGGDTWNWRTFLEAALLFGGFLLALQLVPEAELTREATDRKKVVTQTATRGVQSTEARTS